MLKQYLILSLLFIVTCGCQTEIKNKEAKVLVEAGAKTEALQVKANTELNISKNIQDGIHPALGSWVGYFEKGSDVNYKKEVYVGEGFIWGRENKINISIDKIEDSKVYGHSVVAGNDRSFEGTISEDENGTLAFNVKEPGDHKYDGEFNFKLWKGRLNGKWTAFKDIEIKNRKYSLEKKDFTYNPDVMLKYSKSYVDWSKKKTVKDTTYYDGEEEEWIEEEFATATDLIYKLNASNTLLSKSEVENLKKGDLTIIRNTIYARHGYSFKNRPLRVFFDAQKWYIPVHADIKEDFTDLEKKNIELLLKYEKNASEYYDRFGRG